MAIKIVASEKAWAGFVRRAKRAFPYEYIEALWGEETIDSYRITDFKKIKLETVCKTYVINYSEAELRRQKWLAKKDNKVFLGTVHTHPSKKRDTAASDIDHHEGAKDGEKVMGIVLLYKDKDSERFVVESDWWFPQSKMEFVLLPE